MTNQTESETLSSLISSSTQTSATRVITGSVQTGIQIEVDHTITNITGLTFGVSSSDLNSKTPPEISFAVTFETYLVGVAHTNGLWPLQSGMNSLTYKSEELPPLLFNALKTISITSSLPPTKTSVVQKVLAKLPINVFTMTASGSVTMENPFDCVIGVVAIKGDCFYQGMLIGYLDATLVEGKLTLPGKSVIESPPITVKIVMSLEAVKSAIDNVMKGQALVSAKTTVRCSFSGYELDFDYTQSNIPMMIR
ncbi:hypothetical protein HK100_011759, partial [Physocladia obscura]